MTYQDQRQSKPAILGTPVTTVVAYKASTKVRKEKKKPLQNITRYVVASPRTLSASPYPPLHPPSFPFFDRPRVNTSFHNFITKRVNVVKNKAKQESILEHPAIGEGGFLVDSPESKKEDMLETDVN